MKLRKLLAAVVAVSMLLPATVALAATPVYENGFEGTIGGATVVTREGDVDGLPVTPNIPKANPSISPQFAEGVNGQALYLDGNYGVVLDCEAVGDTYSVAFWVNPSRFSTYGPIIQIGQDLLEAEGRCSWLNFTKTTWTPDGSDMNAVVWSRSQKAALELGDDPNLVWPWYHKAYFAVNYDNQNPLEKNKWAHVVITVDGSKPGMDPVLGTEVAGTVHSKLYINGELFGEGPVAKYTFTDDSKIYLGINCWDYLFKGYFDDFRVYNTVLTDAEVVEAMNTAVGGQASTGGSTSTPKTGVSSLVMVFGLGAAVFGAGAVALGKKKKED